MVTVNKELLKEKINELKERFEVHRYIPDIIDWEDFKELLFSIDELDKGIELEELKNELGRILIDEYLDLEEYDDIAMMRLYKEDPELKLFRYYASEVLGIYNWRTDEITPKTLYNTIKEGRIWAELDSIFEIFE